jgi:hypothetical protein
MVAPAFAAHRIGTRSGDADGARALLKDRRIDDHVGDRLDRDECPANASHGAVDRVCLSRDRESIGRDVERGQNFRCQK